LIYTLYYVIVLKYLSHNYVHINTCKHTKHLITRLLAYYLQLLVRLFDHLLPYYPVTLITKYINKVDIKPYI